MRCGSHARSRNAVPHSPQDGRSQRGDASGWSRCPSPRNCRPQRTPTRPVPAPRQCIVRPRDHRFTVSRDHGDQGYVIDKIHVNEERRFLLTKLALHDKETAIERVCADRPIAAPKSSRSSCRSARISTWRPSRRTSTSEYTARSDTAGHLSYSGGVCWILTDINGSRENPPARKRHTKSNTQSVQRVYFSVIPGTSGITLPRVLSSMTFRSNLTLEVIMLVAQAA
jgi:hypothetical protein